MGQLQGSYQVGLAGMLVSASEAELAGDYQPGQVVMVSAPGQPGQEAAVSEADMSRWCALGLATCSPAAMHACCRQSPSSEHRQQPDLSDHKMSRSP